MYNKPKISTKIDQIDRLSLLETFVNKAYPFPNMITLFSNEYIVYRLKEKKKWSFATVVDTHLYILACSKQPPCNRTENSSATGEFPPSISIYTPPSGNNWNC